MWVGAPSVNYCGLPKVGPNVTVDMGWTTWVDVVMLTVGVGLVFVAGIVGIFKSTIGGILGVVGAVMTLFSFIGFLQIMYYWVWTLMGPAFFILCIGAVLCLVAPSPSPIRAALLHGKRSFVVPILVALLIFPLIVL